jgi:hypothetical protein
MDKKQIEGLIFYFENATDVNEGIREQTMDALRAMLARIEEDEAAAARKRKSPNKSGIVQLDPETFEKIAEFATQKEALAAIGKEEKKSGISDAANGRTKTHMAYGYVWCFKDELDDFLKAHKQ